MKNIQAQREKIGHLANLAKNLLAEKGDQTWTKEEQATFDGYTNEIESLKGQIRGAEKLRELEAENFFNAAAPGGAPKKDDGMTIDALAAVAIYLRHGNNVTAEQAVAIRNAMSTTTPAEGGYTVPSRDRHHGDRQAQGLRRHARRG